MLKICLLTFRYLRASIGQRKDMGFSPGTALEAVLGEAPVKRRFIAILNRNSPRAAMIGRVSSAEKGEIAAQPLAASKPVRRTTPRHVR